MTRVASKRFGGWELRGTEFDNHFLGLTRKQAVRQIQKGWNGRPPMTKGDARKVVDHLLGVERWYSDCGTYKVTKQTLDADSVAGRVRHQDFNGSVQLAVRINEGRTYLRDWRDLQAIKNDLVGEEYWAFETYPAESQLHDTGNLFHLWVLPEGLAVPIGYFRGRDVSDGEDDFQRPLDLYPKD